MQEMIRRCYERAKKLLLEKRKELELVAQTLLVKETLDADEIKQLLETGKLDDPEVNEKIRINIQGKEQAQADGKPASVEPIEPDDDRSKSESPSDENPKDPED
jgi:cell division protease FtsH